jgi:hypothetical protein
MSNLYIKILPDFMINEKICIHMDYDINYKLILTDDLCNGILNDLHKIRDTYSLKDNDMIFLVDYSKVNFTIFPISKLKKLVTFLTANTEDILYKCILYNTSKTLRPVIKIIKTFMDPVTAKKIIIDDTIANIIRTALYDKTTLENISKPVSTETSNS